MAEIKNGILARLLAQTPVNALSAPVTANQNMLAQAMRARTKPEFQMQQNTPQGILDAAALATSPVPILGDLAGIGADAYRFATDPGSRNWLNYGLAALGALPMVPAMSLGLGKLAQSQGKTLGALPAGPARNQAGAIVYHGSPHKFDAFDSSKIGTGEGAQAYGHGLYFAENPAVANSYKSFDELTPQDKAAINVLKNFDGNAEQAAREFERRAARADAPGGKEMMLESARRIRDGELPTGNLYKVDLPDEAIAKMLDWDKPLSQQDKSVMEILPNLLNEIGLRSKSLKEGIDKLKVSYGEGRTSRVEPNGRVLMNALSRKSENNSAAVQRLAEKGIPGIRYLDGGSRGAGEGTRNYVVFPGNEGLLKILERQ